MDSVHFKICVFHTLRGSLTPPRYHTNTIHSDHLLTAPRCYIRLWRVIPHLLSVVINLPCLLWQFKNNGLKRYPISILYFWVSLIEIGKAIIWITSVCLKIINTSAYFHEQNLATFCSREYVFVKVFKTSLKRRLKIDVTNVSQFLWIKLFCSE